MENGQLQNNSFYAVRILKIVILFTRPMTQISEGNKKCKRLNLNADKEKRGHIQENFQTVLDTF